MGKHTHMHTHINEKEKKRKKNSSALGAYGNQIVLENFLVPVVFAFYFKKIL